MKTFGIDTFFGLLSSAAALVGLAKTTMNAEPHVSPTGREAECPCCHKTFHLGEHDDTHVECTYCGASHDERLLWIFLQKKTRIMTGKHDVLWLSPEHTLGNSFKMMNHLQFSELPFSALVSSDEHSSRIQSNRFDVALSMETVADNDDDLAGLTRVFRMLKPGGWAMFPAEVFQLKAAGFTVHSVQYHDFLDKTSAYQYGVDFEGSFQFCFKPETAGWVEPRYALNPFHIKKVTAAERVSVTAKFL